VSAAAIVDFADFLPVSQAREAATRQIVAVPPAVQRREQPDLPRFELDRRRRPLAFDVR
jgi:hypothetical protein